MATANMLLTLPTVGVTAGPAYASQINAALEVVDRHDHSTGSGVQITPAGLNINADLSFNENDATDLRTARFTSQPSALTGASPDLACLYVVADDLYYNDGAGNQIALTIGGSIAGATGNITGLVAPAAVTYTSGGSPNYKFISTATESANIDAASYLMRNPGVTATYALTLQAPTLSNNYSITLPALPGAASFLQIDSSGVITAAPSVALGITAANLAADSVTTAKIADLNVTNAKIANATITASKFATIPELTKVDVTTTFVVPTGVDNIVIVGIGGGGGGGGGGLSAPSQNTSGGGGGASGQMGTVVMAVTPGETLTASLGSGGTGGAFAAVAGNGSAGGTGGTTTLTAGTSGWVVRFKGGLGGAGGIGNNALGTAAGGTATPSGGACSSAGGSSVSGLFGTPSAGDSSVYADGGAAGANGPSGTGGGGGAGGFAVGGAGGAGDLGPATVGTLGSGGGGSGGSTGAGGNPGAVGGAGRVYVFYVAQ